MQGIQSTSMTGPVGQQRGVGKAILLAIVTLGIYSYVWTYKTHQEIKQHSGIGVGGVVGLVIYMAVSAVTFFVLPSEIRQMHAARGIESPVKGTTGLWLLLPIIGWIVWFAQVQGALNNYWADAAAAPAA